GAAVDRAQEHQPRPRLVLPASPPLRDRGRRARPGLGTKRGPHPEGRPAVRRAVVLLAVAALAGAAQTTAGARPLLRGDPCLIGQGVKMVRFPTSDGIQLSGAI